MDRLKGKIALITGGYSGIGGATACLFAQEGAQVIITGRNRDRGDAFIAELAQKNLSIDFVPCDITSKEQIASVKEHIISKYGSLDILFNNAGTLRTATLEEITDEDWDVVYNTNLKSVLYMCQAFIGLLQASRGVILNNTSINGLHSYIKGRSSYMYATSKSAAIQLTKYLAKNYAPDVRVNALCPGMTVTNLFTNRDFSRFNDCNLLKRMAQPEEIAQVALFLCSDDASFVTGAVIVADGGETLK